MNGHKCDGCRYKGERVEMGFKPFGVCYKETNLIKAEGNYKAETCPYKQALPQLYKTDPEPLPEEEPWPKENPFLNLAPFPDSSFDRIEIAKGNIGDALAALAEVFKKAQPIIEAFVKAFTPIIITVVEKIKSYPNKRVIYLATHGKWRTRKKNINRISKYFKREGKKRAVFAQN